MPGETGSRLLSTIGCGGALVAATALLAIASGSADGPESAAAERPGGDRRGQEVSRLRAGWPGDAVPGAAAAPTAAAAADFDGDGAADLAAAYRNGDGGAIVLRFADPEYRAWARAAVGPFRTDSFVEIVEQAPDILLAGDFDGDGDADLAGAVRGCARIVVLSGNGQGGFSRTSIIDLPDALTSAAAADVNRPDGLLDLLVAVDGPDGPALLVFESLSGSLGTDPERIPVPSAATSILAAPLRSGSFLVDIALAGDGKELTIVPGRDRRLHTPGAASTSPSAIAIPLPDGPDRVHAIAGGSAFAADSAGPHAPGDAPPPRVGPALSGMRDHLDIGRLLDTMQAGRHVPAGEEDPAPALVTVPMRLDGDGLHDLVVLDAHGAGLSVHLSAPATSFIVDSTADTPDAAPGDGLCDDGAGVCTLRAAILETNALVGADVITFALGSGTPTITPASALPTITGTLTIQGDSGGATRIQLNGASAGAGAIGLKLGPGSDGSQVHGLVVNRFGGTGIWIESRLNVVTNCWIGLDSAGGGTVPANAGGGIRLSGASASDNLIGGTTVAARNVISRNGLYGIYLFGASNNRVQGNFIGTNPGANIALGNASDGITLTAGSGANLIGGSVSTPGAPPGNVVSGNAGDGVDLTGMFTAGNVIQGNLIGTNGNGTTAIGNAGNGVIVQASAAGNLIGGSVTSQRNVISGNDSPLSDGIELTGAGVTMTNVFGNFVGLNSSGAVAIPNGEDGVLLQFGASGNTIGAATAIPGTSGGNVVSGNLRDGIRIKDLATSGNLVQGNLIGLQSSGGVALGNAGNGIFVNGAPGTTIGGTAASQRNVVSGHSAGAQSSGIRVELAASSNTTIQGNYVGTDREGSAAILNTLAGIVIQTTGGVDLMTGQLVGGPSSVPGTPPGNVVAGDVLVSGSKVRATIQGNIVGLNAAGTAALGGRLILSNADSTLIGGGTVASRNLLARVSIPGGSDGNTVQGNFIGTDITGMIPVGAGVLTINGSENVIGGSAPAPGAPPGNVVNGISVAGSGSTGNVIRGNIVGATADGLSSLSNGAGVSFGPSCSGNVVGGASPADRNLISGNPGAGVTCDRCTGNDIKGNWIGVDITGLAPLPNGAGVLLTSGGSFSASLVIGGAGPGEGNVISGNLGAGVRSTSINSLGTSGAVAGNLIGVAPDGSTPMGNGTYGIEFASGSNMVIGGTAGITSGACTGSCNTIRFNGSDGIGESTSPTPPAPIVRGNRISDNAGLGIDLGSDGVTPNGLPDAAPQNFPVITSVVFDGGSNVTTVQGTLSSSPATSYTIEVFSNVSIDASGYGEGSTFRGSTMCLPDLAGHCAWSLAAAGSLVNVAATAIATPVPGTFGTSEFSAVFIDSDGDGYVDGADNCPAVSNPGQIDADFDGRGLACDCDDGDDQVFAVAPEVTGVTIAPVTLEISWDSTVPAAGPGTVHDVLRGLVSFLPVDGGPSETCLGTVAGTILSSGPSPPAGQAFWYLVRGRNACGAGTYGSSSGGTERTSSACP